MKKETLDEAAQRHFYGNTYQNFIRGAQWQAERMYSEKDMEEYFIAYWKANVPEGIECKLSFNEWFNEFKKK